MYNDEGLQNSRRALVHKVLVLMVSKKVKFNCKQKMGIENYK
jgi:hypothetical protein